MGANPTKNSYLENNLLPANVETGEPLPIDYIKGIKTKVVGCRACGFTKLIDIQWAERHGFPPHCGTPMTVDYKEPETEPLEGGIEIKCPRCGNVDEKKMNIDHRDQQGWYRSTCHDCHWQTAKYKTKLTSFFAFIRGGD